MIEPDIAVIKQFFSEAEICGYHTRAFTILQGDDADRFVVCVKDLSDPEKPFCRWVGTGNALLRELMDILLQNALPYRLQVMPLRPNPAGYPPYIEWPPHL